MLSPEKLLSFDAIEQRYVATCYPLPDRSGIASCMDWKQSFTESVNCQVEPYSVLIQDLAQPFPHLARLAVNHFFEHTSIQQYFEGLDFDKGYHDPNLYLFAKSSFREGVPKEVLASILDHVAGCSVKPVNLESNELWSFGGKFVDQKINMAYFHNPVEGPYALVHGIEHGQHIAIRSLSSDEFSQYTRWFEDRWRSKGNPFT